jgi:hypothetical protein
VDVNTRCIILKGSLTIKILSPFITYYNIHHFVIKEFLVVVDVKSGGVNLVLHHPFQMAYNFKLAHFIGT